MTEPARWYVLVDGVQTGPFGLAHVRDEVLAGRVDTDTWVWADGMDNWQPARHVPALVPPASAGVDGWDDARRALPE